MFRISLATLCALLACSPNSPGLDGGPPPFIPPDAGGFYGGPGVTTVHLRLAHLSRTAPTAIDLCVSPHGSATFAGPFLPSQGLPLGLQRYAVTLPIELTAPTVDLRLVAGGAPDCSTPLAGTSDFTDLPPLTLGDFYTATLVDDLGTLALPIFPDDSPLTEAPAGQAQLRVLDFDVAGPASVDVGTVSAGTFTPSVPGVTPFTIPQGTALDSNGYALLAAVPRAVIGLQSQGKELLDLLPGVELAATARYTLFLLPAPAGTTIAALWCAENGFPSGEEIPCIMYPQVGEPTVLDGGT